MTGLSSSWVELFNISFCITGFPYCRDLYILWLLWFIFMSCLSCKPTQRASQSIVYEKLLDKPVRVSFLRPASELSYTVQIRSASRSVNLLFTIFIKQFNSNISLIRFILDCLILVNILDRLILVVLFLIHKI